MEPTINSQISEQQVPAQKPPQTGKIILGIVTILMITIGTYYFITINNNVPETTGVREQSMTKNNTEDNEIFGSNADREGIAKATEKFRQAIINKDIDGIIALHKIIYESGYTVPTEKSFEKLEKYTRDLAATGGLWRSLEMPLIKLTPEIVQATISKCTFKKKGELMKQESFQKYPTMEGIAFCGYEYVLSQEEIDKEIKGTSDEGHVKAPATGEIILDYIKISGTWHVAIDTINAFDLAASLSEAINSVNDRLED